jgi:hypothetical protein
MPVPIFGAEVLVYGQLSAIIRRPLIGHPLIGHPLTKPRAFPKDHAANDS